MAFCEEAPHLHHLPILAAFLERFTTAFISSAAAEALYAVTGDFIDYFGNESATLDFVLEDVNGEVESVEVNVVDLGDIHLIEAQDGLGIAEITSIAKFTARVEYDDPDSGAWDSEDQRMLFTEHISRDIKDSGTATLTVEFAYSENNPSDVDIQQVLIDRRTRYLSLPGMEN